MPKTPKVIRSDDIIKGMVNRYAQPEWALFFEVANGTGVRRYRYADAIAMCLYPSRGLEIHGFEIKVSKSDWRREAADPEKAEAIAAYCDRWWVVTPPGLLDNENIPPRWGWYAFDGKKFWTKKKAEKTDAKPIDRSFLAALLRRADEKDRRLIDMAVQEKTNALRQSIDVRVNREIERRTDEHSRLKRVVEEFEKESGIKISRWGGNKRIAHAVKVVEAMGVDGTFDGANTVAAKLERIAVDVRAALKDFVEDEGE